jgi:nucleotide-binding universal stress UspA family protein
VGGDIPEPHVTPEPRHAGHGTGHGLVVVGVDGSNASLRALAWSVGYALRNRAAVVCVHIRGTSVASMLLGSMEPGLAPLTAVELPSHEHEVRQSIAGAMSGYGINARWECVTGDPAREMVRAARRHRADLLVVGSGRARRPRWRSIAARVARQAPCPVTVVP